MEIWGKAAAEERVMRFGVGHKPVEVIVGGLPLFPLPLLQR
jgi:hypothetical protein